MDAEPIDDKEPDGYLSKAVVAWQKQNPMLTVRATLPMVANGNTIAVHVWFD